MGIRDALERIVIYLINANGTFRANAALTTTWSKIEVTHAGNFIYYGVTY